MKTIFIAGALFFALTVFAIYAKNDSIDLSLLQEGDIIFQESRSNQAKALKLATKSRYTHVGIVFKGANGLYIMEAVQPVRITPFNSFIRRGVNHHFVVKRLKDSNQILSKSKIDEMKEFGTTFIGKDYDPYFGWSDQRIYCTELVWKIYDHTLNIELGELQHLKDFDLTHPFVKKLLYQRYGNRIPYNEKVISVSTMFESENLVTILKYN